MGLIVQTVARWLKGFILLYGIYIVLYGHLTPGGGFAGGVIVACAFILVTLASGQKEGLRIFRAKAASELDSAGVLLFLAIAVLGMWTAGSFFRNFIATPEPARFQLLSGGTMPLNNIGIGLKVASSLFVVFTVLAALRIGGAARREGGGGS
jgi:multicomponent Na+:H+ antiporter subunit B